MEHPVSQTPTRRTALLTFAAAGAGLAWSAQAQAPAVPKASHVPLPPQPARVPFPTVEWARGALPPGTKDVVLGKTVEDAVAGRIAALGQTRAVVVVQGGRIVLERYMTGWGPENTHVSWSVAKSITSAVVGIAVRDGLIKLDEPIRDPNWVTRANDRRAGITFRQALSMRDGLRWRESGVKSVVDSDATRMLFAEGREDTALWAARKASEHAPGTYWRYNTGIYNVIARALARRLPVAKRGDPGNRIALREYMRTQLFLPIGMKSAAPEFDAAGTFYGGSLVYASAQDFARFGLLYLRDGVWDGKRILPAGWVDLARTRSDAPNVDAYGHGWWISAKGSGRFPHSTPLLKNGPYDSFEAQGHHGQLVVVVPSKDLVLVRTGLTEGAWDQLGDWASAVVNAFPDVAPKPR